MHRYQFVGEVETVLTGLVHGVNAMIHGRDVPEALTGTTVVAQPGDEITTDEPFPHAHMVNADSGVPDEHEDNEPGVPAAATTGVAHPDGAEPDDAERVPATPAVASTVTPPDPEPDPEPDPVAAADTDSHTDTEVPQ